MQKFDIIIIGAGLGGLTAAALLSKKKKVLVIEQNNVVGGYMVNFKRRGFEFDAGLHLMYGCQKGGNTAKILKQCGVKVDFLRPTYLYRSIFPEHDIRFKDLNGFAKKLSSLFPNEKAGIESFLKEIKSIYEGIYNFDSKHEFSRSFLISLNTTIDSLASKYIKDQKLKALLFQLWPYFGLPPKQLPTFFFAYPWYAYFRYGGYYPRGGGQALSDALAKVIKKNGSKILLNETVEKIIINKGVAQGVVTRTGNKFCSSVLISNIDPRQTFTKLIPGFPNKDYLNKIGTTLPSLSAFQVYLGLKEDLRKLKLYDYEIFSNPSYNLDKQYNDSLKNKMEKAPFSLTIYSNLSFAKTNKSTAVITVFSGYDYWAKLTKKAYERQKKDFANILKKRAEKIVPNLSRIIEVEEIATPITMKRYTGNYNGAIYGAEPNVFQIGFRRMDFKTPIPNLFLVGAWTRPGGGTTGVMYSAKSLAERLLN